MALETVALRLVYPTALVLVEHAWAGLAVVLAGLSIGLSILRGWTTDRVTRMVRANVFAAVSEAIECHPALPPPGSPPVEQLESELAQGIPWVEALVGVTLPSIFGNAVALPIIALLSWVRVGTAATLIASAAMVVGVAFGAVVVRKVGALGEAAWSGYQPVARLIESGFRGRVELAVHRRASAHRARLLNAVAHWSTAERRAFMWGGIAAWSVPVATALTAAALAKLVGADPVDLLQQIVSHPTHSVVVAGLLALTALPALSSLSRGLADFSKERPHLDALERFVGTVPSKRLASDPARSADSPISSIRADHVRFTYPAGRSGERPSLVEADLVWQARETLAILGSNGCGKTTLTWLLMGIIEPEAGAIEIEIDRAIHPPAALTGRIAYLPQQPYFGEHETVHEAIRFVAPDATDESTSGLISALLAGHFEGGVQTFLQRTVMSLSMGERRAVAVARVLLRGSDLIVLDEPEANLDGELRDRVMAELRRAKSRSRMLIVTHDEAFAKIADRVYRMRSSNPPSEVPLVRDCASELI